MAATAGTQLIRRSQDRGRTRIDWLDSYHTFSFGDYYNPAFMAFSDLRVINEDVVAPSGGFGTHPHRDMEIITVILDGELEHKDSMGNGSVIRPGDVQRMTAGTGVLHSEFNPSSTQPVHLLQIWILPERTRLEPSYEERSIPGQPGQWQLLASRDGRDGSVTVHQDVLLYRATLEANRSLTYEPQVGRSLWLQVATGTVEFNGQTLNAGDAIGLMAPGGPVVVTGVEQATVLLFDLRQAR